jgi:hypothetical protein
MRGRVAKRAVIPNTISAALALGRSVIAARRQGVDPVAVVAREVGGSLLFSGTIRAMQEEEALGFYFTTAEIAGDGPYTGRLAQLVIKNESMYLALDGRPRAYFPDLVLLLEPQTGRGIMSVELTVGSRVSLVGVACHPRLREAALAEAAQAAFSPARYGRPTDRYRPLEDLA